MGVIRILIERRLTLSIKDLINTAYAAFSPDFSDASTDVIAFIGERLDGYCRDKGYSAAEVDAVVGSGRWWGIAFVPITLDAVRAFAALPEAPALAAANKRISNILKKAGDVKVGPDPKLFIEPVEIALHKAMVDIVPRADVQFNSGDYTASLQTLAALRAPVDAFFEGVMVNADDLAVRANRLGLLATLHAAMNRVADLSKLAA